ncbi:leucine-rich repeat domain-containing protein [Silvanigrella aquatica]|uniref:Uncharacterized protein n=1 Tax=Silvanigrella aquatica TaxID=1915309 RepID=A0A1L4D2F4_9BACT|nr:leucine-rich repeat domain-containing protein [Silvanigrella aquatica]APJ04371.1 hypothetical protein AXG55_10820 [Silvanigrella aquatica]
MKFLFQNKEFKNLCIISILIVTLLGCTRQFNRDDTNSGSSDIKPLLPSASINFNTDTSDVVPPLVYLLGGVALYKVDDKNDVASAPGFSGVGLVTFPAISFTANPVNSAKNMKVVTINAGQPAFCKNVVFTIANNFIYVSNPLSNKLPTMTTCTYSLTSSTFSIPANSITFTFNYTVQDWASSLGDNPDGKPSYAKLTAKRIMKYYSDKNLSDSKLDFKGQTIFDVSPFTALVKLQTLNLSDNFIQDINPLMHLTNLTSLNLFDNEIKFIPDSITKLKLNFLSFNTNSILSLSPTTYSFIKSINPDSLYGNPGTATNFGN